jgi:hypothetical protein
MNGGRDVGDGGLWVDLAIVVAIAALVFALRAMGLF